MNHKSEQVNEIAAALAAAQGAMTSAGLDSTNPHLKKKYASLAAIWAACRGPLSKNALALSQIITTSEAGSIVLRSELIHSSGQWLASEIPIGDPQPKSKAVSHVQAYGSQLTYLKRYSLAALVGVVVSDDETDDDGVAGPSSPTASEVKPKPKHELDKARPYSPLETRRKIKTFVNNCIDKGFYVDSETGELLPIEMHPLGAKTTGVIASTLEVVLANIPGVNKTEARKVVLEYLFLVESTKALKAAEAAAILRLLFNGSSDAAWFNKPPLGVAKSEIIAIYHQEVNKSDEAQAELVRLEHELGSETTKADGLPF